MILKKLFISLMVFIQSFAWAASSKEQFYKDQEAWKKLQLRLPSGYQLDNSSEPQEYYWQWKNNQVHVDYYPNPNSKAKVILLHGVGTNGRQMSLVLGHPLAQAGYETMALDLLEAMVSHNIHRKVQFVMKTGFNWSVILSTMKPRKTIALFFSMGFRQVEC